MSGSRILFGSIRTWLFLSLKWVPRSITPMRHYFISRKVILRVSSLRKTCPDKEASLNVVVVGWFPLLLFSLRNTQLYYIGCVTTGPNLILSWNPFQLSTFYTDLLSSWLKCRVRSDKLYNGTPCHYSWIRNLPLFSLKLVVVNYSTHKNYIDVEPNK